MPRKSDAAKAAQERSRNNWIAGLDENKKREKVQKFLRKCRILSSRYPSLQELIPILENGQTTLTVKLQNFLAQFYKQCDENQGLNSAFKDCDPNQVYVEREQKIPSAGSGILSNIGTAVQQMAQGLEGALDSAATSRREAAEMQLVIYMFNMEQILNKRLKRYILQGLEDEILRVKLVYQVDGTDKLFLSESQRIANTRIQAMSRFYEGIKDAEDLNKDSAYVALEKLRNHMQSTNIWGYMAYSKGYYAIQNLMNKVSTVDVPINAPNVPVDIRGQIADEVRKEITRLRDAYQFANYKGDVKDEDLAFNPKDDHKTHIIKRRILRLYQFIDRYDPKTRQRSAGITTDDGLLSAVKKRAGKIANDIADNLMTGIKQGYQAALDAFEMNCTIFDIKADLIDLQQEMRSTGQTFVMGELTRWRNGFFAPKITGRDAIQKIIDDIDLQITSKYIYTLRV